MMGMGLVGFASTVALLACLALEDCCQDNVDWGLQRVGRSELTTHVSAEAGIEPV